MRAATKRSVLKFSIVALSAVLAYSLYRCYTHKPQYGGADDEAPEPDAITDKRTFWVVMSVVITVFLLGVGYMLYSMKKNYSIPKQAPLTPTQTVRSQLTVARKTQKPRQVVTAPLDYLIEDARDTWKEELNRAPRPQLSKEDLVDNLRSIKVTKDEFGKDLQRAKNLPDKARTQQQARIKKLINSYDDAQQDTMKEIKKWQNIQQLQNLLKQTV